jgi:multicomponent Na+:H+ antiporter subunit F
MADALLVLGALLMGVAFMLALYRFMVGPSVADRVVAFDTLTVIAVSAIVVTAWVEGRAIYLDVALIYALLSFLGVVVVARYMERGL